DVKRPRREHRTEDGDDQIEAAIRKTLEVARITFLEPAIRQPLAPRALTTGLHEVGGNIHAEDVSPQARSGERGGPITASEVEHLRAPSDVQATDERLTA